MLDRFRYAHSNICSILNNKEEIGKEISTTEKETDIEVTLFLSSAKLFTDRANTVSPPSDHSVTIDRLGKRKGEKGGDAAHSPSLLPLLALAAASVRETRLPSAAHSFPRTILLVPRVFPAPWLMLCSIFAATGNRSMAAVFYYCQCADCIIAFLHHFFLHGNLTTASSVVCCDVVV
jgi:hypothetical protein